MDYHFNTGVEMGLKGSKQMSKYQQEKEAEVLAICDKPTVNLDGDQVKVPLGKFEHRRFWFKINDSYHIYPDGNTIEITSKHTNLKCVSEMILDEVHSDIELPVYEQQEFNVKLYSDAEFRHMVGEFICDVSFKDLDISPPEFTAREVKSI